MESSMYSWLQQPHQPDPSRHPHPPEWQKQPPQQPIPTAASPQQQPSLDLSDFTNLGDLPVASSSSAAAGSPPPPQSPFYQFSSHAGFYGNPPYYPAGWPAPQSSDPIPLSNYSTLNGATTTNNASSHQQQTPPMMIDPALTTMNGSTSNGTYSQSTNYPPSAPQQQQQRQPSQQQYSLFTPFPMSYFFPQQQQQQQGTLSPHALHAPATNNSLMGAYYQPQASTSKQQQVAANSQQPPPVQTPKERKAALLSGIRPLLHESSFTGAAAVTNLVSRIFDYGVADVDASTRLEILTKIRDGAGNQYFRAWAENSTAVDITREWLKVAFTASREGNDTDGLSETIMPLLHIIDRLPMSVESLKVSKLGKIVVKLVKEPPSPAIKDMASNVERRWRQMVTEIQPEMVADDSKSKKRKLADPPPRSSAPPLKKAATGTAARPVAKKEPASLSKVSAPAVKDAKSDSSFFSAPKPKPKLPSFKKAPPAPPTVVKKEDGANIAQPSAIDPFQEALKSMKTRKGSPLAAVVSTPSPHGSAGDVNMSGPSGATASGKPRKTVTWAPDDKLESVRLIERAIYGDENSDGGVYSSHSVRDLDRSEGAALHMHLFEETIDWVEPLPIEIPADIPDQGPRGAESQEKATQEQREQTALVSLYMSAASIPDSPAEPSQIVPDEEVDKDAREMTAGPEADSVFWSGPPIPVQQDPPPATSVADLVGQLAAEGNSTNVHAATAAAAAAAVDPMIQQLPPEQVQQLLAQLTQMPAQIPQQMHMQQQQYGDWPGLNQFSADYSQQSAAFQDDGGERNGWFAGRGGGRGRGRGRGRGGAGIEDGYRHNKRRLCNFFAAGRCKYGDQCDYSHDMSY